MAFGQGRQSKSKGKDLTLSFLALVESVSIQPKWSGRF
jgi:hypothetical protein